MFVTKRQKEILSYVEKHIRRHGYAPTIEEIGRAFRLSSPATVHKHLRNLERKGLIRRKWNHSRAIELAGESPKAVPLPLLGNVAAGRPIEPVETDEVLSVPEEFLGRRPTYALRVVGDSMIEDGILDGDYLIVEQREEADNGKTVVALVRGEATVKRFYRQPDGRIRLEPANPTMEPIVAPAEDVELRGVVIGVLRRYR
ncbi:MAG: LexA repressor [Candidatus Binatia bacterium]|nr:MAG: LexA repressor [Candidatus Binatia bacterium]